MDNIQTTRKWSELQGLAVVTLTDGKKVGACDDFYFVPTTQNIYAFRIKTGLFGHKALLVTNINAIGQHAITIASEDALLSESEDEHLATLPLGQSLPSYKVMSASGTLVGTLGEVLIDISRPAAPLISAFELSGGLLERISGRYPTFSAAKVISYGQDVLIIPDEVAQTLQK
jgi:uncharacterized protein YrrD